MARQPLPPCTLETTTRNVRRAEGAWNKLRPQDAPPGPTTVSVL